MCGLASQLGDLRAETQTGEAGGEPGAEQCTRVAFALHRRAEDLAHLFLRAPAMKARAPLELELHVFIEPAYHQLVHTRLISRYQSVHRLRDEP